MLSLEVLSPVSGMLNRQECIAEQQLRIQDDISRVSTELEELDQLINRHVAVNSICLNPVRDTWTTS